MNFHRPPIGRVREGLALYLKAARVALRRPWIVPQLVRAAWAFRARRWFATPPFLPLPPRSYLRWRMETAYGDPDAVPSAAELERYLAWALRMRRAMRHRAHE